jgi:hypothetical protein
MRFGSGWRNAAGVSLFLAVAGLARPAVATYYAPIYAVGPSDGDFAVCPTGINDNYQVVGTEYFVDPDGTTLHPYPFRYNGGEFQPIMSPVPGCPSCNNSRGSAIAQWGPITGGAPAFIQNGTDGPSIIDVPGIGQLGAANGMSDDLYLAGTQPDPNGDQAYRWDSVLGFVYVPPPDTITYGSSKAFAVDNAHQVVGTIRDLATNTDRAFLYRGWGNAIDMTTLLPAGSGFAYLQSADATIPSFVVGEGVRSDGTIHGFRYRTADGSFEDLGPMEPLPSDINGLSMGLSLRGDAVYSARASNGALHAFVTTVEGNRYDLNDFVDPSSGWVLETASGMNSAFVAVGHGQNGASSRRGYLIALPNLTPCPVTNGCQTAGYRDPATGTCQSTALADDTGCEDGNRCTVGDRCENGSCIPGDTNVCTAPADLKYLPILDLGPGEGGASRPTSITAGRS